MLRGTQTFNLFRRFLPVLTVTPTTWPTCSIERSPIERIPTELLREVFELLDRKSLWSCMRVCKRWYDVARLYFFVVVPVRHCHRQQAFKCIRSHPGLAARVADLHFFDKSCGDSGSARSYLPRGPFDIELLLSALPLLTNLRTLCFEGYDTVLNRPPLLSRLFQISQRQNSPPSLQRLSFEHCGRSACMVPELLSLFSVNTLVIDIRVSEYYSLDSTEISVPSISPPSITIQNLVLGREAHMKSHLSFFERTLVPGTLRGFATARCSPFVEQFLKSDASQNLLSISITVVGKYDGTWQTVAAETNVCKGLGVALKHCTRLQYIKLGFIHRDDSSQADLLSNRDTFLPILANLPRTLRVFSISVYVHGPKPWCCTSTPVGLDAVDRKLSPSAPSGGGRGGRLSDLRRVELGVYRESHTPPRSECMKPFVKHDPERLPRLSAAGLLRYHFGNLNNDNPRSAEVYWPSDM